MLVFMLILSKNLDKVGCEQALMHCDKKWIINKCHLISLIEVA